MLITLMKECNNYFFVFKITDNFVINDEGEIVIKKAIKKLEKVNAITVYTDYNKDIFLVDRVVIDDILNTTTIILTENELIETTEGVIFFSIVPSHFKKLVSNIENIDLQPEKNIMISEKLGEYSYTKATNKDGQVLTWRDIYKDDIKKYRKIFAGYEYVKELEF